MDIWAAGVTLYCFIFGKVSPLNKNCTYVDSEKSLVISWNVNFLVPVVSF